MKLAIDDTEGLEADESPTDEGAPVTLSRSKRGRPRGNDAMRGIISASAQGDAHRRQAEKPGRGWGWLEAIPEAFKHPTRPPGATR